NKGPDPRGHAGARRLPPGRDGTRTVFDLDDVTGITWNQQTRTDGPLTPVSLARSSLHSALLRERWERSPSASTSPPTTKSTPANTSPLSGLVRPPPPSKASTKSSLTFSSRRGRNLPAAGR